MPYLPTSPMTSPSLRQLSHFRTTNSYFAVHPHAHAHPHPQPQQLVSCMKHHAPSAPPSPSKTAGPPSPMTKPPGSPALKSCLKQTPSSPSRNPFEFAPSPSRVGSPFEHHHDPAKVAIHPIAQSQQRPARRSTLSYVHPPLGPQQIYQHPHQHQHQETFQTRPRSDTQPDIMNHSRRRPSFKIDLPPRPHLGVEVQARAFAAPTPTSTPIRQPTTPARQLFDPDYVILRPESVHANAHPQTQPHPQTPFYDFPSPYTLNQMRAPTPWLRAGKDEIGEDGEWLRGDEVEGMRGLAVA
ncbi:hypothetical protein P7C73_g4459, partial [Tremellales sp. Uapishka_1]